MIGSPGSGKTMLARRFLSILPPLTFQEAIEVTKIHSIAGVLKDNIVRCKPFRSPHHTISDIALIGGGCKTKKLLQKLRIYCEKYENYYKSIINSGFLFRYLYYLTINFSSLHLSIQKVS